MRKILVSILLLLSSITLPAQSPQVGWETLYAQLLEQDDEAGQSDEETYELLSELAEHPIALNQATREDLERIPFLSEAQIEELIAYITQYHGMRTMGELSLIESLDGLRRALLPYFLLLTDDETTHFPSLHTILQRGRHTVVGQMGVPFYDTSHRLGVTEDNAADYLADAVHLNEEGRFLFGTALIATLDHSR